MDNSALAQLMAYVGQETPQNVSPLELLLSQPDAFTAAARRQRNAVMPVGGRQEGAATIVPQAIALSPAILGQLGYETLSKFGR